MGNFGGQKIDTIVSIFLHSNLAIVDGRPLLLDEKEARKKRGERTPRRVFESTISYSMT